MSRFATDYFYMKYDDLIVWQKGAVLVKEIYQETKKFPTDEKFGLTRKL